MRRLLSVAVLIVAGWLSASSWAQELRDPFLFGSRGDEQQAGLLLVGVLWDAVNPLAMIGDNTLRVGDIIEGWRIVDIQQDGMMIERGDRQEFLTPGTAIPSD